MSRVSRRAVLGAMPGAVAAVAVPAVAWRMPSSVEALIAAHKDGIASKHRAFHALNELQEAHPYRVAGVAIANGPRGEIRVHSVAGLNERDALDRPSFTSIWGHKPEVVAKRDARWQAWREELAAQEAEQARRDDLSGITAAEDHADRVCDAFDATECDMLAATPSTMAELRALLAELIYAADEDVLDLGGEDVKSALRLWSREAQS